MKALIVTKDSSPDTADSEAIRGCIASLEAMGIKPERQMIASGGTFSASKATTINSEYACIVLPLTDNGFNVLIDDANIDVPIMPLSCANSAATLGSTPGVTGSPSSQAERYHVSTFTSNKFQGFNGKYYTAGTGTALFTIAATDPLTAAAITGAGSYVLWSGTTGSGNGLYCSAVRAKFGMMLPYLVQMAVNDGNMAAPPRKGPVVVDLDHVTGEEATADPDMLDVIASYVPAGGVIWANIHNTEPGFTAMPDNLKAKLQALWHNPFKYNWHDHSFNPLIVSGTWPNETVNVAKATVLAKYDTDEATWNAYGLEFDYPAYVAWGSNSVSDACLEFMGTVTDKAGSGDNLTSMAGKGAVVCRLITASERAPESRTSIWRNQHKNRRKFRGMTLINCWDLAIEANLPYDALADWVLNTRYLTNAISTGMSLYIHDSAFIAADQDPGIAGKKHGYSAFQLIADTGAYLKNVAKAFADPVDYA